MFLKPTVALLVGVEVVEHDMKLAIRVGGSDLVHEAEKLDTAPPRLNTDFLGNRTRAATLSCQQHYPGSLHVALGGARQRASSTLRIFRLSRTSLASGIIPILNNDSPSKKSG